MNNASKKKTMSPRNRTAAPRDGKPAAHPAKPPGAIPPTVAKSNLRSNTANTSRGRYRERSPIGEGGQGLASASGDLAEESLGDILVESDPDGGAMMIWFLGRPS